MSETWINLWNQEPPKNSTIKEIGINFDRILVIVPWIFYLIRADDRFVVTP